MANITAARTRRQEQVAAELAVTAASRKNNEAAWRRDVTQSNKLVIKALKAGLTVPNVAELAGVSRQQVDKLTKDMDIPSIRRRTRR